MIVCVYLMVEILVDSRLGQSHFKLGFVKEPSWLLTESKECKIYFVLHIEVMAMAFEPRQLILTLPMFST